MKMAMRDLVFFSLGALVLLLIGVAFVCWRWAADDCRSPDVRSDAVVSRLLRDLYSDSDEELWSDSIVQGIIGPENHTNRGAEVLYAVFGKQCFWMADNDQDGRFEACDAFGDPIIVFTSQMRRDVIIAKSGRRTVYAPPYFKEGWFLGRLRYHLWQAGDEEALEHWTKLKSGEP